MAADNEITWVFKVIDAASRPIREIAGYVENLAKTFDWATGQLKGLWDSLDFGVKAGIIAGVGTAFIVLGKLIADAVKQAVEGVWNLGMTFMKAGFNAATFQESVEGALTTMMGAEKASAVFKDAIDFAAKTPATTQDVIKSYMSYAAAGGIQDPQTLRLLASAEQDVAALNPARPQAGQMFNQYINRILTGAATSKTLLDLSRVTSLGYGNVLKSIGDKAGIDPQSVGKNLRNIDPNLIVSAILDVVAAKEGGQIGNLTIGASRRMKGLLSTLESRYEQDLMQDLDKTEGYGKMRTFLQNLADMTDPKSEFGQKIMRTFKATFSTVLDSVFGGVDEGSLGRFLDTVATVASYLGAAFAGLSGFVGGFLKALMSDLGALWTDGPLSPAQIQAVSKAFENFGAVFGHAFGIVLNILQMINHILGGLPGMVRMFGGALTALPGIGPALGQLLMAGANGFDALQNAPDVKPKPLTTTADQMSGPKLEVHPGAVQQNITVQGTADPHETADLVHEKQRAETRKFWEDIMTQMGAGQFAVPGA